MDVNQRLENLLVDARAALAAMATDDRSVSGLVQRVGSLRYAEGTLTGFLDAMLAADPKTAALIAPKIESFIAEAIAARALMD